MTMSSHHDLSVGWVPVPWILSSVNSIHAQVNRSCEMHTGSHQECMWLTFAKY